MDKSTVASNRLVVNKNFEPGIDDQKLIPVRYLEERQIELYKKFPLKQQVAKSTFKKYLTQSRIYKKPQRLTDMCDYCETLKKLSPELIKGLRNYGYNVPDLGIDVEEAKKLLTDKRKELHLANEKTEEVI